MLQRGSQLGNANATAAGAVQAGGTVATGTIATAATTGAMAASTAALAIPIIGAAVAGVTIWLSVIGRRNAQKSQSTAVMYDIQAQQEANFKGYFEGPRTVTSRRVALQNFDGLTALLKSSQGCGNPELGDAGRRCWQERAEPNGVYSWYRAFRDPIANDKPNPDPPGLIDGAAEAVSSFASQIFDAAAGSDQLTGYVPILAAVAAAAIMFSE